ncbi:MAG: fibronectin type III domain-containing protein [Oscillospiraceae bacterium]
MIKKIISAVTAAIMAVSLLAADAGAYTVIIRSDGSYEKIEVPEAVPSGADEVPFSQWLEEQQNYSEPCLSVTHRGSDSITLHWNRIEGAETVRLYKYNPTKKKYSAIKSYMMIDYYLQTSDTVSKLSPSTKYQFMIRYFDAVGSEIDREIVETSTIARAPKMTLTDIGQSVKVELKATQTGYTNYEIYYLSDPYYEPLMDDYSTYDYYDLTDSGFKLFKRITGKSSAVFYLKQDKPYTLVARAYKINSDGQKVYGGFTAGCNTFYTE